MSRTWRSGASRCVLVLSVHIACVLAGSVMLGTVMLGRVAVAGDQDLNRFLPVDGNSVYQANGLLRQWPEDGPTRLWTADLGWGKSAVVEVDGKAYTATETDDKQWAVCLDPNNGQTLWKKLLYPGKNRHFANGPVTSPVVDGDRIYFIPYATRDDVWDMCSPIVCLKSDGTELWREDQELWGTEASTPVVVDDVLFVATDNRQHVVLAAMNKLTGAVLWSVATKGSSKGRELGAPASLTYQVVDGVPQVIVATYGTQEILGVHAEDGKVMWRYAYPAPITIGLVSTPVAVDDRLFVCAGEGRGKDFSVCLQMQAQDGEISCQPLYSSTELQVNMYNTVAVYDDAVFGFGGNRTAGFLHCTNFADGQLLWKAESREWTNHQNLIIAGGLIYAVTKDHHLVMAEASREGYRELGRTKLEIDLGRPQQPTIANGRLYLRGLQSVVCYQVGR
jgi:outer membrane protein assembly factor BamB